MATGNSNAQTISWIALIVAIIALLIALVAWNTANVIDDPNIGESVDRQVQNLEQEDVVTESQQRMQILRTQTSTESVEASEAVQTEIADIRINLRDEFAEANQNTQQAWQEVDAELENIEQGLRNGTINALEAIDRAITALQRDLRSDEE